MKQSLNLKTAELKKSFSSRDVLKLDPQDAPFKASSSKRRQESHGSGILSKTACFDEHQESSRSIDSRAYTDHYQSKPGQEKAQNHTSLFPVNATAAATGFNSISSIGSEGVNNNFTSVQSIQTKAMVQKLSDTYGSEAASVAQARKASLDSLLQQTLLDEVINNGGVRTVSDQEEILSRLHRRISVEANLNHGEALSVLQQAARYLDAKMKTKGATEADVDLNCKQKIGVLQE